MIKRIILIVILFLTSCQTIERAEKPDEFYGDEKMVAILAQLYIYEGLVTSNRKMVINKGIEIDQYIYDRFNTDSITFKENFHYYTTRVQEYYDLLSKVEVLLESKRDSIKEQLEKNPPKIKPVDSIKTNLKSYLDDKEDL